MIVIFQTKDQPELPFFQVSKHEFFDFVFNL